MKAKITILSFDPLSFRVDEMPDLASVIEVRLPQITAKLLGIDGVGDIVVDSNIMSVCITPNEPVRGDVAVGIIYNSAGHLRDMHSHAQKLLSETYLLEKK